ncbi:beta strand repeat-containing protein [Stagnimonas aquatica]|nr:Ig-like domain-containing protein [Stagnimonas aquatica]
MPFRVVQALVAGILLALGLSACGGGGSAPPTLVRIEISPLNVTKPLGTSQQFVATAIMSDNSKGDVSASTVWVSSDPSVATISGSGVAIARKLGKTTISANFQGNTASTELTVGPATVATVAVTPVNSSLPKGASRQFSAMATFTDNSTSDVTATATWTSSSTSTATVSNAADSRGLVTAVAPGLITISASQSGATGNTSLTVTAATLQRIEVTPSASSVAKGNSRQFAATGVFTDNSTQDLTGAATWSSSAPSVASVSNEVATKGRAKGLEVGSSTIGAAYGGLTGSTTLAVSDAVLTGLQVTPATSSRPKGAIQQFTAIGTFSDQTTGDVTEDENLVWSSADSSIASISNAAGSSGQARGVTEGGTTITATSGEFTASASFTVTAAALARIDITPTTPSVPVGTSQQFTATGVYTDNSSQDFTKVATWSSTDSSVLEVSNSAGTQGLAVAKKLGAATIKASHQGLTGSTDATVSDASLIAIEVTPPNKNLAKGFSLQYAATGIYSDDSARDVTGTATWTSSNTSAASISNAEGSRGLAKATLTPGSTNISASIGGVMGATSLTVTNATVKSGSVTPTDPTMPKGVSRQFTATVVFTDGSTQDVTSQVSWTSSATGRATVGDSAASKGQVTAVSEGEATITATVTNDAAKGASASSKVTVTPATLGSITVTPATASAAKGNTQNYKAEGLYSDNSVENLTETVTWSSSDTAVATVSNASGTRGVVRAVAQGSATITAALGSVSGTASFTGTAAVLKALAISPASASVAAGRSQQYVATGTYSDDSTQNLTKVVTWSSKDSTVATISNAADSAGLASTSAPGETEIKAVSGGISSDVATLKVTDAVVTGVTVKPANQTIGNKTSLQYTATLAYSDGSSVDTRKVTWSSSDTTIADVSNASGSEGLATAKAQGAVTITATSGGFSGSTPLTVGPAALQSIKVAGKLTTLPVGYKVQYTATGTYTDASTQDLTSSVSWQTLNGAVATVSNDSGSKGVVTTVALGSTSVVASLGGVSGNAGVTVTNATLSSIAVTPANPRIAGSDSVQLTATATFSDGGKLDISTQVTWASSNTSAVTVDQSGLASGGFFPGNATVSASKGSPAVTGQTTVTHTAF